MNRRQLFKLLWAAAGAGIASQLKLAKIDPNEKYLLVIEDKIPPAQLAAFRDYLRHLDVEMVVLAYSGPIHLLPVSQIDKLATVKTL